MCVNDKKSTICVRPSLCAVRDLGLGVNNPAIVILDSPATQLIRSPTLPLFASTINTKRALIRFISPLSPLPTHPDILFTMPAERSQREIYDSLSALLSPSTAFPAGRYRSTSEVADGLKRIRRIILTEGIPEVVSGKNTVPSAERRDEGGVVSRAEGVGAGDRCALRDGVRQLRHSCDTPKASLKFPPQTANGLDLIFTGRPAVAPPADLETHAQGRAPPCGRLPPLCGHGPEWGKCEE